MVTQKMKMPRFMIKFVNLFGGKEPICFEKQTLVSFDDS